MKTGRKREDRVLDARVLALGVLANDDEVDVRIRRSRSHDRLRGPQIRV